MKKNTRKRSFLRSFNHAANGLILCFKSERNMKFHFFVAGVVLVMGLFYEFNKVEFILLLSAIIFVLFAEMINTALEYLMDASSINYNPLIRVAKDIAAGAVLLSVFYAIVVGYLLFYDRMIPLGNKMLGSLHQNPIHLSFIALGLTVLLIIALKSKYSKNRGTYFQGGTVSGHSAISFLMATIIGFNSKSLLVITLSYLLALLVAESRIEGKIHRPIDTVIGALLGTVVGIIIFLIFG